MSKNNLVFLGAKRTAFGALGGSLKTISPTDLGVAAAKGALEQSGLSAEKVGQIIVGNVLHSAPDSIYSPRHIGLKCGVPIVVPALGVNRLCGSGFESIVQAQLSMRAGDTETALVGGIENMSLTPYVLRNARFGYRMGNNEIIDQMTESLTDLYAKAPMAITAENLAVEYNISREACDHYSLNSQQKTEAARTLGVFKNEITPVLLPNPKGEAISFVTDEHPKPATTLDALQKLKPIFKKEGVVTAGTASGIVDGAAMLVVSTEDYANRNGLKPMGRLVSYASVGCEPTLMGIGPVPATKKALEKAGLKLSDMDLIEINEAFAAQTLSVMKALDVDPSKCNLNGGAIAIGHPLAASGSRIITHLLYELQRQNKRYGLGTACIGGGQGIAVIVERF